MKIMKQLSLIVGFFVCSSFLLSCSNNLSRSTAKDLIIQKYSFPQSEKTELLGSFLKDIYGHNNGWLPYACLCSAERYNDHVQELNYLQNQGLITIKETDSDDGKCHTTWVKVELTNEGNKYLVGKNENTFILKTSELDFGEITGIQQQEQMKIAEVHYTVIRKNITPFGGKMTREPIERSATFTLFDDGWRIAR